MACNDQIRFQSTSSRAASLGVALGAGLGWLWVLVWMWIARSRQRRTLADLDDRLLRDIAVSRKAAAHEAAKPFWRA